MVILERNVTYSSVILAVIALAMVLIALSSFYRRFSRPLALVSDGTQRFYKGQYTHRIGLEGDGDIAKIGQSLDLMAEQVEIRTQDLVQKKTRSWKTASARERSNWNVCCLRPNRWKSTEPGSLPTSATKSARL